MNPFALLALFLLKGGAAVGSEYVSKLDTTLPEIELAKTGAGADCAGTENSCEKVHAPKMKERWKSGLHHPAAVYAKQVTQGRLKRMCCKWEILACQRHLNDLKRQGTKEFPYVFDCTRADRIIRWFGQCIQVRGPYAGKPVTLQPWQVFDLSCVLGWVHMETGARRFRRTFNERSRGTFKSTENACKCLYFMCADAMYPPYEPEKASFEMEPEVECAAVDREQAKRVFDDAKKIAEASPNIRKRLHLPKANPVSHKTRGGKMRALSKDTRNKDSGAPTYFEVDEYHAHASQDIYDLGFNSFGKRRQSLLDVITTAGDGASTKPCYKEELYCKKVLAGDVTDETYFCMIRQIDEGDNPHDEAVWAKANPCLRYPDEYSTGLLEQTRIEHDAAYNSGEPEKIRKFLTRRMCQWQASSAASYLTAEQLELARQAQVKKDAFAQLTKGCPCYGGFDLGKRIDLTGVGAVFLLPDGRIGIKAEGFMPRNRAEEHERTDRVPYLMWAKDGYCTLTPGDVTDNGFVFDWFEAGEQNGWKLEMVCYDGHNATDLAIRLCEARNNEDFCVEINQNCAGQNMAVKGFRELLLQGKVVIEENPLLIWCLGNAIEIVNNFGDVKLNKKHKDDTERIDPLAAVMNGLSQALLRRNNPTLKDRILSGNWSM